jgi:hypothetical protein
MIDIWFVGNTGVRNPLRIQEGLKVYADSNLVGKIRGVSGAVSLMNLLCQKGILNNGAGKDATGSYGRKWRLVFNLNGFTYDAVNSSDGFTQEDIGPIDGITPFGYTFLKADTVPAVQECFLRAMSMKMKPLGNGKFFSPLCWTLAVLLKLEQITGDASVNFAEFAVCIQTTNSSFDIDEVTSKILEIRDRKSKASAKKRFDHQMYEEFGKNYPKKSENFKEYGDMNLRYLRASGIVQRKGRGIAIVPEKHTLAIQLAQNQISEDSALERYRTLYNGPTLPTDNMGMAREVLSDLLRQLDERHIVYDLSGYSFETAADINNARRGLEAILSQYNEIIYADNQRNQWQEICDYMELIRKRGGKKQYEDDREISVPKEEASAYLEWIIWRAFLAIDHLANKPYEARRFRIDQDFLPVNTAPGNGPDLIAEFNDCVVVIEVTLSESSRQEAMEGEPVRRHVADLMQQYDKPVYGLFIANRVDSNTAETFRMGVWYTREDKRLDLHIVPFTLIQFENFFRSIFTAKKATPQAVISLMNECERHRKECEAPEWKAQIESVVTQSVSSMCG